MESRACRNSSTVPIGQLTGFCTISAPWSEDSPWPRAHPSLSAGQPCMPATPTWCADMNQTDPLLLTPCPQVLKLFVSAWRAKDGDVLQRWCRNGGQIACERLFYPRCRSVTTLLQSPDITIVIKGGDKEADQEWACPRSRHLGVDFGEEQHAPCRRWLIRSQKVFIKFASLRLSMLFSRPTDV